MSGAATVAPGATGTLSEALRWHPEPLVWLLLVALAAGYAVAVRGIGHYLPPTSREFRRGAPEGGGARQAALPAAPGDGRAGNGPAVGQPGDRSSPPAGTRSRRPVAASRRQVAYFALGWLCLALATTWPLAGLAVRWSLAAHVAQQLLLVLAVPPLCLSGLPRWTFSTVTRPARLDALLRYVTRPAPATVVFCGTVIGSFAPPVVAAQNTSGVLHGFVELALLLAGLIMWLPALRLLPGASRLTTGGRMIYLFTQSLLPNFPALILIFAERPLYPVYAAHAGVLGFSALADQQLAGVLAKVVGIAVLWGVATVIWVRAERAEQSGEDPDPLTWEDVERELRRADRRSRRPTDAN